MVVRVLFLASNPSETEWLRLDREARVIDERLREGDAGREIEVITAWAVRPTDLSEKLLRYTPHVVHFSGHGGRRGVILEGTSGTPAVVPQTALAQMFRVVGESVTCVVLNACHSQTQAEILAEHIGVVVGTSASIPDGAAVAFAAGFYRGISFGRSLRVAYELGKNEVALHGSMMSDVFHVVEGPGSQFDTALTGGKPDAVMPGRTAGSGKEDPDISVLGM